MLDRFHLLASKWRGGLWSVFLGALPLRGLYHSAARGGGAAGRSPNRLCELNGNMKGIPKVGNIKL